jgi:hypothetical protein
MRKWESYLQKPTMDPFIFPGIGFDYDVEEMDSGAKDRIKKLKPIRFEYKCGIRKGIEGFLAHELQEIVPEAVIGEKDAVDENGEPIHQKVLLGQLVPLLTAGMQEAIRDLEILENRLNGLEEITTAD